MSTPAKVLGLRRSACVLVAAVACAFAVSCGAVAELFDEPTPSESRRTGPEGLEQCREAVRIADELMSAAVTLFEDLTEGRPLDPDKRDTLRKAARRHIGSLEDCHEAAEGSEDVRVQACERASAAAGRFVKAVFDGLAGGQGRPEEIGEALYDIAQYHLGVYTEAHDDCSELA